MRGLAETSLHHPILRARTPVVASLLALAAATPLAAEASEVRAETTLQTALLQLAARSGEEIVSLEPGLRAIRVHLPPASLPLETALRQMLRGTGYRAERIGPHGYRIVR